MALKSAQNIISFLYDHFMLTSDAWFTSLLLLLLLLILFLVVVVETFGKRKLLLFGTRNALKERGINIHSRHIYSPDAMEGFWRKWRMAGPDTDRDIVFIFRSIQNNRISKKH